MKARRTEGVKAAFVLIVVLICSFLNAVELRHKKSKKENNYKIALGFYGDHSLPGETSNLGKGTVGGALAFDLGFGKYFGAEISAQFSQYRTPGWEAGLQKGSLIQIPLQLSLKWRYPINSFLIYLVTGAHYSWNQFSLDGTVRDGWQRVGFKAEDKVAPVIGYQGGWGIEFYLGSNITIAVDARYFLDKGKIEYSLTETKSGLISSGTLNDIRLDRTILSFGLKWYVK